MLRVRVFGRSDSLEREELLDAVNWMARRVLGPQMASRLRIDVLFNRKLKNYGACSDRAARVYTIEVNPRTSRTMQLRTIAHELVHVDQFARGRMVRDYENDVDRVFWKRWRDFHIQDEHAPHESEAYRLEKRVYRAYRRYRATLEK